MAVPNSTTQLVDSLEQYDDTVSWINDMLTPNEADEFSTSVVDLNETDHQINQLLSTLEIASEDTSGQLERIIEDVSRAIPRLAYDLHFMKDGATTLQNALQTVLQRSRGAIPKETSEALDSLHHLDMIRERMEATREVLREAESWSTLEHEVTSLILEKNYAKAAERLSEGNKSMIVFQNTPDYDPRRTLLVNLQNQLEAALSTALVSAINAQDSSACKDYFLIFSIIQRESEFRNYYYASRRMSVVSLWQNVVLLDCDPLPSSLEGPQQNFADFLSRFYSSFLALLDAERISICSIFPDPSATLSQFITSALSSLQPTVQQRLTSYSSHMGDSALSDLIFVLRTTESFAADVEKIIEKVKSATLSPQQRGPSDKSHKRRASRMSISLRVGQNRSSSSTAKLLADAAENTEWDQELFKPFLDFQTDYGSLERRYLDQAFLKTLSNDTRDKLHASDRPRLFRERSIDIFSIAEGSMSRCKAFTYGYGTLGLIKALDGFIRSFVDNWTADIQTEPQGAFSLSKGSPSENELSDLDYTAQDWSNIQLSLHLLSSARIVSDRLLSFETKLQAYLSQVAVQFRLAMNDPSNFLIASTRGESLILDQSTLNSADLQSILTTVENEFTLYTPLTASLRPQHQNNPLHPLLLTTRKSLSSFAQACQFATSKTILLPLRNHLTGYASLSAWRSSADTNLGTSSNELRVPVFSLSHSETIQRVAEGLLNLPRLFEVYADDDALAFSLETLPYMESETLQNLSEQAIDMSGQQSHRRKSSIYLKPSAVDIEAVSSAWLISLGHTFLEYVTSDILPDIPSLSIAGAAQLASDLEYLSNIMHALNVEHGTLEKWKNYVNMDAAEGSKLLAEHTATSLSLDPVLERVSKLRDWQ